ncbi:MAG: hypothetical protein HC915_11660, partial [Anaerolineae bacterium]|nr:hypothetical protein [Anaerolineae bacterium]
MLNYRPATAMALLILAAGLTLILFPDFFYLVDNFRVRLNTIFKFWYQGWIFLSIATAFGVYHVLAGGDTRTRGTEDRLTSEDRTVNIAIRLIPRLGYLPLLVMVLWLGLLYPFYAIRTRALHETNFYAARDRWEDCQTLASETGGDPQTCGREPLLTLDGRPTALGSDEWAVITCFEELDLTGKRCWPKPPTTAATTSSMGALATLTGVPTLLG